MKIPVFSLQKADNIPLKPKIPYESAQAVEGLDQGIVGLAAGAAHTCVVMGDDTIACWGSNAFGQLGNSSTDDSNVPVETN